jgi:hypothetical protein
VRERLRLISPEVVISAAFAALVPISITSQKDSEFTNVFLIH